MLPVSQVGSIAVVLVRMPNSSSWTSLLSRERARLLSIAYRMLGSFSDSEDLLQEVWLRADKTPIESTDVPVAWLNTVLTRLCLNHLKSARVRREVYVGPWLPEPILTGNQGAAILPNDPLVGAERISLALLRLLEALSPTERAVYVLRELFEHSHAEVSEIVGLAETNCRQLARRARVQVESGQLRYAPSAAAHAQLLSKFVQAVQEGAVESLQHLLAQDVVLRSDGGGKAKAAIRAISGAEKVAKFLFGVAGKRAAEEGWTLQPQEVNGLPALVALNNGVASSVTSIETNGDSICSVFLVVNPDKLRLVQRSLKNF